MITQISLEAAIALKILQYRNHSCQNLEEPGDIYGQMDVMQACELAALVRYATERLNSSQLSNDKPCRLFVAKDYRIFLQEPEPQELKLRPMLRAVFILYLRHPEGIAFKRLADYKPELMEIYLKISGRGDIDSINASLDRLVDSSDNYINVNRSLLATELKSYFDERLLHLYTISGRAGENMKIKLDRSFVVWE